MSNANPTNCCDIATACCEHPLPSPLIATIANVSDCTCADGATIELNWNGTTPLGSSSWKGSAALGSCNGQTITLKVLCVADALCAFKKFVDVSPCSSSAELFVLNTCTCTGQDPLNAPFPAFEISALCCNGMPGPNSSTQITVAK